MKLRTILYRFGSLAALALIFAVGPKMIPAQSEDSEEISRLLSLAKSNVALLEEDASLLDLYTRSKLSWESHSIKVGEIKEHVNALGKVNKQLADQRVHGSPWQQKAIEQIDPLLRELARTVTATIKHLNDNPSRVHMPSYREYARANYEVAGKTAGIIRDFVNYDEAKARAESLEAKLELITSERAD